MPETRLLPKPSTALPELPEHPAGTSEPYTPSDLSYEFVDAESVSIDWRDAMGDDCEGWTAYEAFRGESGFVRVLTAGESSTDQNIDYDDLEQQFEELFPDVEPDETLDHELDLTAIEVWRAEVDDDGEELPEGPAMMYYYPLGDRTDPQEAARDILRLPLCVVAFSEAMQDKGAPEFALALVGGGTDLSWEICEAYIRLGYFPPAHFELPRMSGRADGSEYGNMERDRRIIRARRASLECIESRAKSGLEQLATLEADIPA